MLPTRPSTLDPLISPSPSTLDTCPSSPLVTIAIPTYNRADSYLPQALRSALGQTYPNLDIVVSDNCSTDQTRALVTSIADSRLRYFRHDANIGPTPNHNFCVEQAKGKYLLILHDDDLIDNDFVESCIQVSHGSSDVGIIRTGTRLINSQGDVLSEVPNVAANLPIAEFFRQWFSNQTTIYLCSTLFNAQRLTGLGRFKSRHNCYDDTMAVVRLAAEYGRIDVPKVKASARIHAGKMGFATQINNWCEDSLDLLSLMCELVPEKKDEIFKAGFRFFSRANYRKAAAASSPFKRFIALLTVLRYFRFRHLPSRGNLLAILYGTRLYEALRFLNRRRKYVFSRV